MEPISSQCWANHISATWLVEPTWFMGAVLAAKSGAMPTMNAAQLAAASSNDRPYSVNQGVAVLRMDGPMMKFDSKYGGTNTVRVRRSVRQAAADPEVSAILMVIDSPGGEVAGTKELADDVAAVNAKKPVYAYIEDLGASAALWVASQARKVYANATAFVGSIGVFSIVEDSSKKYEMDGIKVHVVSTGAMKGVGADGSPLTDEYLQEVQAHVNGINDFFIDAVAAGRGMKSKDVRAIADGRVWIASEAKKLGIIDHVQTMDETFQQIVEKVAAKKSRSRAELAEELIKQSM